MQCLGKNPTRDGAVAYAERFGFSCALNASGWYVYNNRTGVLVIDCLDYPTAAGYVEEMNFRVQDRVIAALDT